MTMTNPEAFALGATAASLLIALVAATAIRATNRTARHHEDQLVTERARRAAHHAATDQHTLGVNNRHNHPSR